MNEKYPFAEIESKWQKFWRTKGFFKADQNKTDNKYYCLMMFPYPSAALHVGTEEIISSATRWRVTKKCGAIMF